MSHSDVVTSDINACCRWNFGMDESTPLFYKDVITYTRLQFDPRLANICWWKRPNMTMRLIPLTIQQF